MLGTPARVGEPRPSCTRASSRRALETPVQRCLAGSRVLQSRKPHAWAPPSDGWSPPPHSPCGPDARAPCAPPACCCRPHPTGRGALRRDRAHSL